VLEFTVRKVGRIVPPDDVRVLWVRFAVCVEAQESVKHCLGWTDATPNRWFRGMFVEKLKTNRPYLFFCQPARATDRCLQPAFNCFVPSPWHQARMMDGICLLDNLLRPKHKGAERFITLHVNRQRV